MKKRLLSILTLLTMAVSLFSPVVLAQESFNEEKDEQTEVVEEVVQEEETEEIQEEKNHEQGMESSEEKDTEPAQEDVVKLEDLTIHDKDGNELKEDEELIIKDDEKVEITAIGLSNKDYQWQISNPNSTGKDDKWIDIQDETEETLKIDYALIKNVLVKDTTEIRVRSAKNKEHFSTSFKVKVEESQVEDKKDNKAENEIVALAENTEADEEPELGTWSIVINYVYQDGTQAAPSYTASVAKGTDFKTKVKSPEVQGYKPEDDKEEIVFNEEEVNKDITVNVTYIPAENTFTVRHLFQNVDNDEYTEGFELNGEEKFSEVETHTGFTEDEVGKDLAKEVPGFYSLNYDSSVKIAADGSTEIEIKYDRDYYLMRFDLDGGYGVEPIYARYQTPINIKNEDLNKVGHTFKHWERNNQVANLPDKMPAESRSYKAIWTAEEVGYTVVYWYEDADSDENGEYGYSYAGQYKPNDKFSQDTKLFELVNNDLINNQFDASNGKHPLHNKHFSYNRRKTEQEENQGKLKADGSSLVNIYFSRNTYTLVFDLNDSSNTYNYQKAELTKDNNIYLGNQYKITAKFEANIEKAWPLDEDVTQKPIRRTGNGEWWFPYRDTTYYLNGWQLNNRGTINSSKRFTLTDDLISNNNNYGESTMYANWTSAENKLQLNYYVESFVQAPGEGRTSRGGKWFDLSDYSQEAIDTGENWSAKSISGLQKLETLNWVGRDRSQNFYYERNRRDLSFVNVGKTLKNVTHMFEQPVKESYFEPEAPENLEYAADAYYFDGWYTTADAIEGTRFNFEKGIMPDRNLALYANWVRKERKVNFFLTNEMNEQIGNEIIVRHGDSINDNEKPANPENGKYDFVGWFYKDKEGKERAFDLSMPVTRDLNLYAKWTSNVIMDIKINYELKDGTKIAESTKDSGLAGDTKTYPAKFGEELNTGYKEGYFPEEASHSITIDIDDESKNEYTFIYVERESVPYTVRYLEEGTNKELAKEKYVEENKKAVVTEEYKRVKGYRPDAYQKRLILAAEGKNILTFYYVKDDVHAPIKTTYYQQNIEGDNYREVRSEEDLFGKIGEKYSPGILEYDGFILNKEKSNSEEITLTEDGYEFELYYDRKEYPYKFQFIEEETNKELEDPVTGEGRYEATIPGEAKDIPGYTAIEPTSKSLKIDIEEPADQVENNIHRFFYKENEVTLNYEVIGPENSGKVTPKAETVKAKTGTATGSTAEANEGYRFIGWFKDEEGKEPVITWVRSGNRIEPQKTGLDDIFESATYYAKFEKAVADLTIEKSGAEDIDENQSFIFNVKGTDDNTNDIDLTVTILGNGKLTVKDLPIGSYTVTEQMDWSWRYTTTNEITKEIKVDESNYVRFVNERMNGKWLSGDSYKENKFK